MATRRNFIKKSAVLLLTDLLLSSLVYLNYDQIARGFILTDVAYATSECIIRTHAEYLLY